VISETLEAVKMHFGDDLDASTLFVQLAVLSAAASGVSVKMKHVVSSTLAFTSNCNIFYEVRKLLQRMYVLPVTSASAGTRLFGLADSVWSFRSEPFRSRDFSVLVVPVSRHFGLAIKSCRNLLC